MIQDQIHTRDIKLIPMEGSQGICLPDFILRKYGFSDSLLLEETAKGVLLRKKEITDEVKKISWEETYKEMAGQKEDWDDFDIAIQDGITGEEFAEIAVDQIRTISKQRLKQKIDQLEPEKSLQLRQLITDMYGEKQRDI